MDPCSPNSKTGLLFLIFPSSSTFIHMSVQRTQPIGYDPWGPPYPPHHNGGGGGGSEAETNESMRDHRSATRSPYPGSLCEPVDQTPGGQGGPRGDCGTGRVAGPLPPAAWGTGSAETRPTDPPTIILQNKGRCSTGASPRGMCPGR